jgi:flagellar hook-basal body complex protein FliE
MIDAITSISGSLPVAGVGRAAGVAGSAGGDGADFGAMLSQLAGNAANVVRHAEATAVAGVQGTATVQQVVEAVMSAEQTLQGAVAIRDKVVAAYLELSRMQI